MAPDRPGEHHVLARFRGVLHDALEVEFESPKLGVAVRDLMRQVFREEE